jgi:hypothetical protein
VDGLILHLPGDGGQRNLAVRSPPRYTKSIRVKAFLGFRGPAFVWPRRVSEDEDDMSKRDKPQVFG